MRARGDEDDNGLVGRMLRDREVGGLDHGELARRELVDVEALDADLERHRTHIRVTVSYSQAEFRTDRLMIQRARESSLQVECVRASRAEPLAEVLGVGDRGAQAEDAQRLLRLRRHEPHARHNHLLASEAKQATIRSNQSVRGFEVIRGQ